MAEESPLIAAGITQLTAAADSINETLSQTASNVPKEDSGLTPLNPSVITSLEKLLGFSKVGAGNMGQIVQELENSLNDEMKALYEQLKDPGKDLREIKDTIVKKFSDGATDKAANDAPTNKADDNKGKNKPTSSDLVKLSAKYAMGPLLLHEDLSDIKKILDKANSSLLSKDAKDIKATKDTLKDTKVKKEKPKKDKKLSLSETLDGLANIDVSVKKFGDAAKTLVIIGLLAPVAKLGVMAMDFIVSKILNLSIKYKKDAKTIETFTETVDNIGKSVTSLVKGAALLAIGIPVLLLGAFGALAAIPFIGSVILLAKLVNDHDKEMRTLFKNLDVIGDASKKLVFAAFMMTIGIPFFITGAIGTLLSLGFIGSVLLIATVIDKNEKTLGKIRSGATKILAGVALLAASAAIMAFMLPITAIGILGAVAMLAFVGLSLAIAAILNKGGKNLGQFILYSAMLAVGFALLSATVLMASFVGKLNWKSILLGVAFMAIFIGLGIGLGFLFANPYVAPVLAAFMAGAVMLGLGFLMMTLPILALAVVAKLMSKTNPLKSMAAIALVIASIALLSPLIIIATPAALAMLPFGLCVAIGMLGLLVGLLAMSLLTPLAVPAIAALKTIAIVTVSLALLGVAIRAAVISALALAIFGVVLTVASLTNLLGIFLLSKISKISLKDVKAGLLTISLVSLTIAANMIWIIPGVISAILLVIFGAIMIGAATLMHNAVEKLAMLSGINYTPGLAAIKTVSKELTKSIGWLILGTVAAVFLKAFANPLAAGASDLFLALTMLSMIGAMPQVNYINGLNNIKEVAKVYSKLLPTAIVAYKSAVMMDPFITSFCRQIMSLNEAMIAVRVLGSQMKEGNISETADDVKDVVKSLTSIFSSMDAFDTTNSKGFGKIIKSVGNVANAGLDALIANLKGSTLGSCLEMLNVIQQSIDIVNEFAKDPELKNKLVAAKDDITGYVTELYNIVISLDVGTISSKAQKKITALTQAASSIVDAISDTMIIADKLSSVKCGDEGVIKALDIFAKIMGTPTDNYFEQHTIFGLARSASGWGAKINAKKITALTDSVKSALESLETIGIALTGTAFNIFKDLKYEGSVIEYAMNFYGDLLKGLSDIANKKDIKNLEAVTGAFSTMNEILKVVSSSSTDDENPDLDSTTALDMLSSLMEIGKNEGGWTAMTTAMNALGAAAVHLKNKNVVDALTALERQTVNINATVAADPNVELIYQLLTTWDAEGITVKNMYTPDTSIVPKTVEG